ncbi:MAG: nitroreductase [Hyphomicrobiaceae bacterium]
MSNKPDIEALLAPLPEEGRPVGNAIATRRSVRGFKQDPVPQATIEAILALAARAPSGSNIQPWKVYVVAGPRRDAIASAVLTAFDTEQGQHTEPYRYYPRDWREPYISRRRATGWGLYGTLGIAKEDKARMRAQQRENFTFFGAPVGLFFAIDDDMEKGSWLDFGMFLQTIMIAARGFGLDTCPQQAWSHYHRVVGPMIGMAASEILVCGMSLGHIDDTAPANAFWTSREAVAQFASFMGFDGHEGEHTPGS